MFDKFDSIYLITKQYEIMNNNSCQCGSCGHENTEECYTRQCACCLTDHQGAFAKNR